jgi:polar amino acid transport system substrate-binding protein
MNIIKISILILSLIVTPIKATAADLPTNCPEDMAKILERGKIIVGIYYKDKPPFVMTNEMGELYGFDIDIAKDIAAKLGVGLEFNNEAKSYKQLHQLVAEKKVDVIICKFSRTYTRAKNLKFTTPYLTLRRAMLVNKVFASQKKINEYPIDYFKKNRVKIGVREKTSYVEFAKNMFPKAEIVEGSWEDIIAALKEGKLHAVVRDEYEVLKLIKTNPDMVLYFSVYVLKDKRDCIAMAVPPASTQLLYWLNMYLDTRDLKKTVEDLMNDYPEIFKDN